MTPRRDCSTSVGSRKRFKAFDFTKEDECVDKVSEKFLRKFENPRNKKASPLDKYKFLQCFAGGTKNQQKENCNKPIDLDSEVAHGSKTLESECRDNLLDVDGSITARAVSHLCTYLLPNWMGISRREKVLKEDADDLVTCVLSSSSSDKNGSTDTISHDDNDSIEMSSSASVTPLAEKEVHLEEQFSVHDPVGHEIDSQHMRVVFFPDFQYGDIHCTRSQLTFLSGCIKVEGSTGAKEAFTYEWAIEDVLKIESVWYEKVETVILSLQLKSKDVKGTENGNETTGVEPVKFAICDPLWSEGLEAIQILDFRYKDVWSTLNFAESFGDIIYPEGDPDAVLISKRDVELLQPETFVNDTIIDFYIKYLKSKIEPAKLHRFHFFNSFFFRKLADLDKDPFNACEGRETFLRVRKWTAKVNIFEKDFIFIPVNFSLHWSLIIICYPGEVAHFIDDESDKLRKGPCILHMNSLRGSHTGLKSLVQSYLCEEWKERHSDKDKLADVPLKFSNLRFISLELPQQENLYDCGLFLLHYVERFVEEVPANFNPFKITEVSNFLTRHWFPPVEASLKRLHIQKLIFQIMEECSRKVTSSDCTSSLVPESVEPGTEVQPLEKQKWENPCNDCPLVSEVEKASEVLFSTTPPLKTVQCFGNPESTFREMYEPHPFSRGNYHRKGAFYQRGIISPIKEVEESHEQIPDSPLSVGPCRWVTESASDISATIYGNKTVIQLDPPQNLEIPIRLEESDAEDSVSRTSISESLESCKPLLEKEQTESTGFNQLKETDEHESPSTSSDELAGRVVEDSQDDECDSAETNEFSSFKGNKVISSHQGKKLIEIISLEENSPSISNG